MRKIPISLTLLEEFEKLKGNKLSQYVFTNHKTNKPYYDIKRSFTVLCKIANIQGLVFHDLRYTSATRMVASGIDLATVQYLLGHADLKTTSRYTHPVSEQKLRAVEALDRYNKCNLAIVS